MVSLVVLMIGITIIVMSIAFVARRRSAVARPLLLGAVAVLALAGASPTFADGSTAITLTSVLDPTSLATAVATLGGAALLAAFTVGGGFRIAKKAYSWIFSKV